MAPMNQLFYTKLRTFKSDQVFLFNVGSNFCDF